MSKAPESLIRELPVLVRRAEGGVNVYSTRLRFSYDSGGPLAESVAEVMTTLGKHAEGVIVVRTAIDYIEVVSGRLVRLRRTVSALIKELKPFGVDAGFPDLPSIPREVIYPYPGNP